MHPDYEPKWMEMACRLAFDNVGLGGGPFGAVIVRDGAVVATGVNRVTANCDPTAHAEVQAVRAACQKLEDFRLTGCTVYSSCEPCPMCLSALYWAGVEQIYYCRTAAEADAIGFSDKFIYEELARPASQRHLPCLKVPFEPVHSAFRRWAESDQKTPY